MKLEDYLTGHDAATSLGVSYHTFMRARRRGFISGHQLGWQWLFHKDEVARYAEVRAAAIAAGVVSAA